MAESHKKQLIGMFLKAFELEGSSSDVSEKVAESNLTAVGQPTSKVATNRTTDWVDSVSSQPLLTFLVRHICWPSLLYQFCQTANLAHAIHTSNSHNHEHTALSDPSIYSYGHRAMPQFGSANLLPLQVSVPSVLFTFNKMQSSADVLPPPSAVRLQTMSSNTTNGSFAIG